MSAEQNKQIVRRLIEGGLSQHNLSFLTNKSIPILSKTSSGTSLRLQA